MKGKRYTTEEKVRILREADAGEQSIADVCREKNISDVTFHRWKRQFGHMDLNEAKRLKELAGVHAANSRDSERSSQGHPAGASPFRGPQISGFVKRVIHEEANREFREVLLHYVGISPELGARFYREMEQLMLEV